MENYLSLIFLVLSPLIAFGVILSPLFGDNEVFIRRFSKSFAGLHFLYTVLFLAFFDPLNYGMSYESEIKFWNVSWLNTLGIKATFAVDALSLLLIVLTSFIFLMAFVASKSSIRTKHKFYYSMLFLLQTSVLGVFCSKDMFLFFLFWELELIPMYFLISEWGSGNAKKSAMKFILYTFTGSIFLLLGMLALYFYSFVVNGHPTADLEMLNISEAVYPLGFQILIFLCFLIGFAVKLPIVPFHTWLPDAHTDAATPVSMILAALLLKMGAYGLIRFNMMIFPEVFKLFAPVLMILAVINIIYAACLSIAQTDMKRLIAYSSISHMGIVILGFSALNISGLNGAIFQMIAHAFISAGLFMIAGIVYNRCKTRNLEQLGGLGTVMPKFMIFSIPIALAATGLPLLAGFPGELMSFIAAFNADYANELIPKSLTLIALLGLILSATYILKMLHETFFSPLPEQYKTIKDIRGHQLVILFVLLSAIILFGVLPSTLIDLFNPFTTIIMDILKV